MLKEELCSGFIQVYHALLKFFPLIDARVLRAVAIEHSNDAGAAFSAVNDEIIPFFWERSQQLSPVTLSSSKGETPEGTIKEDQTEDVPCDNIKISQELYNIDNHFNQKQQSDHDDNSEHDKTWYAVSGEHDQVEDNVTEQIFSGKNNDNRTGLTYPVCSNDEDAVLFDKNVMHTHQDEILRSPESSIDVPFGKMAQHEGGLQPQVNVDLDKIGSLVQDCNEHTGPLETDFDATLEKRILELLNDNVEKPGHGYASLTFHDANVSSLEHSTQLLEALNRDKYKLQKYESGLSSTSETEMENLVKIVGTEDKSNFKAIDALDEIIEDSRKRNKKTLLSAIESVISLMRDVEIKEQVARHEKQEAGIAGEATLNKVDEHKQLLKPAKEANHTHSVEVYGEKLVLAMELKELESCLVSLAVERNTNLASLDEVRQNLELRLAAAENQIKLSQQKKLEKENAARELLAEQESISEKVMEESENMKKQAEENTRLHDLIEDRRRVVDMLCGEMGVLCQDVRQLKENYDDNAPLSKILASTRTSFILVSSSSSLKNLMPLDQMESVPVKDDSSDTQTNRDREAMSEEEADHNEFVERGWNIVDHHETEA